MRPLPALLIALATLCLTVAASRADWPSDPALSVIVSAGAEASYWPPSSVSDGAGGVYVMWTSHTATRLQHVSARGLLLWPDSGVAVGGVAATLPVLTDGAGGAIVVDEHVPAGDSVLEAFAQRYDASGLSLWTPGGVALAPGVSPNFYFSSGATADGAGGVIVGLSAQNSVTGQRLSPSGVRLWGASGVLVYPPTSAYSAGAKTVAADGAGGGVFVWSASSDSVTLHAQHIAASGAMQWGSSGIAISPSTATKWTPSIVADGVGGSIVGWHEYEPASRLRFLVQRLAADGSRLWGPTGAIADSFSGTAGDTLLADRTGGVFVTNYSQAQRITPNGTPAWPGRGVPASHATALTLGVPASDGTPTLILVWQRYGAGASGTQQEVRAQHLGANGEPLWGSAGAVMNAASDSTKIWPAASSDGAGGVLGVWLNSFGYAQAASVHAERLDAVGRPGTLSVPPNLPSADFALRLAPDPMRAGSHATLLGALPSADRVIIGIRDLAGRRIRNIDSGTHAAGPFAIDWDGHDGAGRAIAPGLYFVDLQLGARHAHARIVALR